MALEYTEEKLNSLDKETIIQLFLSQQEQLKRIDHNLQLVLEQVADLKRHRFGSSSEKHEPDEQISFMEIDETFYLFTKQKPWLTKRPVKTQRPFPAGNRKRNRESGKKIWKDCRSWWSNIP